MKMEISEYIVTMDNGEEFNLIRCSSKENQYYWKIYDEGHILNLQGKWEYEPMPSSRTEEYLYNNRYTLDKAKELLLECEID